MRALHLIAGVFLIAAYVAINSLLWWGGDRIVSGLGPVLVGLILTWDLRAMMSDNTRE